MSRADRPPDRLWASYDQKVSPRQGWQGPWRNRPGRHIPNIGNSFGLPAGTTCPGKTGFCAGCYGAHLERANPGVAPALAHNYSLLTEAAATHGIGGMAALIHDMLNRYEHEASKLDPAERIFRIHWDGDFFSRDYAWAWADTMAAHPDTRFWCYTRSFRPPVDALDILMPVATLTVYLSVDAENSAHAAAQLARWPGLRAAYCADDYRTARDLADARRARGLTRPTPCPENARRIPIATEGQGACVTCAICPEGRRDILFAVTKREHAAIPVRLVVRGEAKSGTETLTCALPDCAANFTRPPGSKGRIPDYCSRACQIKGYQRKRRAAARA